ncbi:MAG: histidine kinase [Acidobacteria bacterium]|nr:histidine kinase [Acidobacteriota bacterium]
MPEQVLINTLLLLISSLFCGLLFIFSLSQTEKTRQHLPLIIFLGGLSIWYFLLTIGQLPMLEIFPNRLRKIPVFGLARPILLLVFTAIAHCYIVEIRKRGEVISKWLSPPKLYIYSFIALSKIRWSLADRFNHPKLAAIVALFGLGLLLVVIFICYRKLNKFSILNKQNSSRFEQLSWPISFLFSIVLILGAFFHTLNGNISPSLYDSYALISALPLIFWLIYYHTPYLFFDVLAKRGIQTIFFAIIFGFYYGVLAYYLKVFPDNSLLFYLSLGIIFSLPTGLLTRLQIFLDRTIDIHLLGRTPFQDLLIELNSKLGASTNLENAIQIACNTAKQALKAQKVKYFSLEKDAVENPNLINISVINNEEILGRLEIEPTSGNRRYLSEDLKFAKLIASNLASTMARLKLQKEQEERKVIELELINTANALRLKALQAQLNPHFLFNSMNLIASLVRSAPDRARAAVQYLSRVYRYVLDSSRQDLVTVADEINFLKAYLDIEQLRFESRLNVTFDLCANLEKHFIPPMLLQPLVENAIKHGLSPKIEGGLLLIKISTIDNTLEFIISDTGEGFDPSKPPKGSGVGISNVQQQLNLRYQTELFVTSTLQIGTEIKFSLPLEKIKVRS